MNPNANLGAYGIMYVIKNKKNKVVSLLLKNGVQIPSNATDIQIGVIVTDLLKNSKSFYNDFSKLLLNEDVVSGMATSDSYSNLDGGSKYDFSKYTLPVYEFSKNSQNTSTTTGSTTTPDSKANWLNQGLGVLQTAFQGYLQLDENKTKRALADASVQISESTPLSTSNEGKKGMSTGAIVGLSLLGVAIVGAITYVIIKKK